MASSKTKAPEQTFEEPKYLRRLAENGTRVRVKLCDDQELEGTIEFYDEHFIRLTRTASRIYSSTSTTSNICTNSPDGENT